jgi:polyhydroxyalkanoate synthesis regulator phasin
MKLSLAQFENICLLSNKNVEKILKRLINESSNAALVSVFDESVILYDHTDGIFRTADYVLNKDDLTIKLENFENIDLVQYEESTSDIIESFFDDESSVEDISESYRKEVIGRTNFVKDIVNEALSEKNFFGKPDYSQIAEVKSSLKLASKNMKFFEAYQERIKEVPMTKIMSFDWVNPVSVSLEEMEQDRVVASVNIAEAHNLWRDKEFKGLFQEATREFIQDVEIGADMFEGLARRYPGIMFLESEDRKAMFGKSMLGDKTLTENLGDTLKGLDVLFEKLDIAELKEEYSGKLSDEEVSAPVMTEEEIDTVVKDLNKLAESISDDNTLEYINGLIESVETFNYDGISPSVVKEVVELLK